MPSKRYAIEAKWEGDDPPWKGWQIIRTYATAHDRDKDFATLCRNVARWMDPGSRWLYRIYKYNG